MRRYGENNMAKTIETWKEIMAAPKDKFTFWEKLLWGIPKYQVMFKKKLSDDNNTVWFCAYVKLEEPLKEAYKFESYRDKNIIGCDTSDHTTHSQLTQIALVTWRMKHIINEHHGA